MPTMQAWSLSASPCLRLADALRRLDLREAREVEAEDLGARLVGDRLVAPLLLQLLRHLERADVVARLLHVVEGEVEPHHVLVFPHPLQPLADQVVAAVGRAREPADDAREAQ